MSFKNLYSLSKIRACTPNVWIVKFTDSILRQVLSLHYILLFGWVMILLPIILLCYLDKLLLLWLLMRNLIGRNRFYNWLLWLLGWRLFDRNYCCLWWYRCLCISLWIWDLTLESVKCWLHGFVVKRIAFAQSIDCCCLWIFRFLPHVLGTSPEPSLE